MLMLHWFFKNVRENSCFSQKAFQKPSWTVLGRSLPRRSSQDSEDRKDSEYSKEREESEENEESEESEEIKNENKEISSDDILDEELALQRKGLIKIIRLCLENRSIIFKTQAWVEEAVVKHPTLLQSEGMLGKNQPCGIWRLPS